MPIEKNERFYQKAYGYLLNEEIVQRDILRFKKEDLQKNLDILRKYHYVPNTDIDTIIEQLKDKDFISVARSSSWKAGRISTMNHKGGKTQFKCFTAVFDLVNKWGYRRPYCWFQIFLNDAGEVVWLGHILRGERKSLYGICQKGVSWLGHILRRNPQSPVKGNHIYYLSSDNIVCRLTYRHKFIELFPNIYANPETVKDSYDERLDGLIITHHKQMRSFDPCFHFIENEEGKICIDLSEHFETGFFYKGPKWNYDEFKKVNYYSWIRPGDISKKEITELVSVKAENGLFRLEIENQTYPHRGYAFLDLKDLKIVKTVKPPQ
jgi:hypothetical protein